MAHPTSKISEIPSHLMMARNMGWNGVTDINDYCPCSTQQRYAVLLGTVVRLPETKVSGIIWVCAGLRQLAHSSTSFSAVLQVLLRRPHAISVAQPLGSRMH